MAFPPRLQMPSYSPDGAPYGESSQAYHYFASPVSMSASANGGLPFGGPPMTHPGVPYYGMGTNLPQYFGPAGAGGYMVQQPGGRPTSPATSRPQHRGPTSSISVPLASPSGSDNTYSNPFSPSLASSVNSVATSSAGPPLRSKPVLHATAPSFVPPSLRRPTLSLRPPPSPSISRAPSETGSTGTSFTGIGSRVPEKVERKRKVVVRLPLERQNPTLDAGVVVIEDDKGDREPSLIVREPLDGKGKETVLASMEQDVSPPDLQTRCQHFDEERAEGLPASIDVYLPGLVAWEDLRAAEAEERLARLGYPSPSLLNGETLASRLNSFIESQSLWPSSPGFSTSPVSPNAFVGHGRTNSLFSNVLPPRLQQAFDNRERPSHNSRFSIGGPLSKIFLPGNSPVESTPWTPPIRSNSARPGGLSPGSSFPPPLPTRSLTSVGEFPAGNQTLSKQRGRRLTLAELSRGIGIEEETEGGVDEARSDPSRKASEISNHTDEGCATNPSMKPVADDSDEEPLAEKLHRHHDYMGTLGLGRPIGTMQRKASSLGSASGYEGSHDSGEEGGEDDNVSDQEFSNPSDEEKPKLLKKKKSLKGSIRGPPNPDNWIEGVGEDLPSGPEAEDEEGLLFQAPVDIDVSPAEFHPPKPLPTPPSTRTAPRGPLPTPPGTARSTTLATGATPPGFAPSRSTSLNVAAPEFVFGASYVSKSNSPTFGRMASNSSLKAAGFGGNGAPGSLVVASEPPSPTKLTLNPQAGAFEPTPSTFSFKLPEDAPKLVLPPTPPPQERLAILRGPLPPLPIDAPHSANIKRQKTEASEESRVWLSGSSIKSERRNMHPGSIGMSPGKDSMRTFKFPSESSQSSQHEGDTDKDSEHEGNTGVNESITAMIVDGSQEESDRSGLKANITTVSQAIASARPFSIRPAASFSPDGRLLSFTPLVRRLPIPTFSPTTPTTPSTEGVPTTKGDEGQRRENSLDDIHIPSNTRLRSRAIPIPLRRSQDRLGSGGTTPRTLVASWQESQEDGSEDGVFEPGDTMPVTPDSQDGSEVDRVTASQGEEDDYPLQILENIIEKQFETLRHELSGFTSLKADLDLLKQDALLDSLVSRIEERLADAQKIESDAGEQRLESLASLAKHGHATTTELIREAITRLEASIAATPSRTMETFENQKELVVAVVSQALSSELSKQDAQHSVTSDSLSSIIDTSLHSLRDFIAVTHAEKANELAQNLASRIQDLEGVLRSTGQQEDRDSLAISLAAHLGPAVEDLRPPPIDLQQLGSIISEAVQSQLSAVLAGQALLEQIRPTLEAIATIPAIDHESLAQRLAESIELPPQKVPELESLASDVANAVFAKIRFDPEALSCISTGVEGLSRSNAAFEQSLADFQERIDVSVQNMVAKTAEEKSAFVQDLETQLAKARNEHGKIRTEKAVLTDRWEADRTALTSRLEDSESGLRRAEEAIQKHDLKRAVVQQTVESLRAELGASHSTSKKLETKLSVAEEHAAAYHSTEVAHISALGERQVKMKALESEALKRADEADTLRDELQDLRLKFNEASAELKLSQSARNTEREAAAYSRGEITSLEKRLASQDKKLAELQHLDSSHHLAIATLTSDFDRGAADLVDANAEINRLTDLVARLEEDLGRSKAASIHLRDETMQYEDRLTQDLEAMKITVTRELQQANDQVTALGEEKEQLHARNEELTRQILLMQVRPSDVHSNGYHSSQDLPPSSTSYVTPTASDSLPSDLWGPHQPVPTRFQPLSTLLEPQITGSSAVTVSRPSPTLSRTSKVSRVLSPDSKGWWG